MLSDPSSETSHSRGNFMAIWSVVGFSLLLGEAFYKVIPFVIELFSLPLTAGHWAALVGWSLFMAYSEGYRGFQKHYSPRFAARAHWLKNNPNSINPWLAPLFCMCFLGTTRKRKIVAYCLTSGIVLLVIYIRSLPQPWRGIIDAGVLIGLSWGLLSVLWFCWQAFNHEQVAVDPEVVL